MEREHPNAAALRRELKANSEAFMRLSITEKQSAHVQARFQRREERLVDRFHKIGVRPSFPKGA